MMYGIFGRLYYYRRHPAFDEQETNFMAKLKTRNAATREQIGEADMSAILARASERVVLPDVPMRFNYQSDVDTLCIRFEGNVSSLLVNEDDELENGVIGIYEGRKLVGVEILDITGQLAHAHPV